ncbi:TatA Sec-independent protein secretion pathway components [Candidatus Pelagibacterales bacterium]
MGLSFWHIIIVVIVAVLLFGRGKISDLMGDVAKGIKSFKKGMSDDQSSDNKDPKDPKDPKDKDQNSKSNH